MTLNNIAGELANLGPRLARTISRDPVTKEYVITDEYKSGYLVRGRFLTKKQAERHLKVMVMKR